MHIAIVGPANPAEFRMDLRDVQSFPAGMGGVPVNGLVRTLLDLGHEVSLFTASPGASTTWRAEGERLRIVAVPLRARARARALDMFKSERRALAAELALCSADVYHAHWTYEFAWACLDADVKPLLVTAHDAPFTILRHLPDAYRLIRLAMAIRVRASIENLTVVTPYLARAWRREMLLNKPVVVIPNSIPVLVLPDIPRRDTPVVLDVADSSRRKNLKVLIRAFKLVRQSRPDARLHLVGPGLDAGGELARWTGALGLSDGVTFLGPLDRKAVAREYAEATLLCHPSLEESQGLCFLEAMSARLPVIGGSNSGGVAWTLFDGAAGKLVDTRNVEKLAEAICEVLAGAGEASAKATFAEQQIQARYGPEVVAAQYLAEYNRLAGSVSGRKKP